MERDKKSIELERVKEELEDLEVYLEEFNAFLPLAIGTVNPHHIIINMNSAFESVTEYDSLEGAGKNIADFFLEEEAVTSFLNSISHGERFAKSTELTLFSKTGKKKVVNLTASARTDRSGEFIGFFIGINDVTELKLLQNNLEKEVTRKTHDLEERALELERSRSAVIEILREIEEERNKTSTLVTNLTDGLVYVDTDWRLEMINPRAEELLGLWGRNMIGIDLLEENISERTSMLANLLAPQAALEREVLEFSDDLIVEVSAVKINDDKERQVGTLVVLHDISQERALDNLKVEFISVAAHQMRTPLAAIKWAFELLLASDESKLAPDLKKIAESGFDSTLRILKIINNFLEVDTMESVDFNYIFAPVNIKKVVEDICEEIAIEARERGIEVAFDNADDDLPYVRADQERLSNVLQNLIENALKYTIESGTITIRAVAREWDMLISVQDNGIGIPASESGNIFTRFFRAKNAKKVETDGNGLGLYTTKKIVERHDGNIWFESTEGAGSTFFFTIPLYSNK